MKIFDYVSVQEVKRVCRELKIRDWTMLEKAEVLPKEAEAILNNLASNQLVYVSQLIYNRKIFYY